MLTDWFVFLVIAVRLFLAPSRCPIKCPQPWWTIRKCSLHKFISSTSVKPCSERARCHLTIFAAGFENLFHMYGLRTMIHLNFQPFSWWSRSSAEWLKVQMYPCAQTVHLKQISILQLGISILMLLICIHTRNLREITYTPSVLDGILLKNSDVEIHAESWSTGIANVEHELHVKFSNWRPTARSRVDSQNGAQQPDRFILAKSYFELALTQNVVSLKLGRRTSDQDVTRWMFYSRLKSEFGIDMRAFADLAALVLIPNYFLGIT